VDSGREEEFLTHWLTEASIPANLLFPGDVVLEEFVVIELDVPGAVIVF
jgi:hypothetical protein